MLTALRIKQESPFDSMDAVAESLEDEARDVFLHAVEALKENVSLTELEAAVRIGVPRAITDALKLDDFAENMGPLRDVILEAMRLGGQYAASQPLRQRAKQAPTQIGVGYAFDILDPRALAHARERAAWAIREIDAGTRDGVNRLIVSGFEEGVAPPTTARAIRDRVGLTAHQQEIVSNYERTVRAAARDEATWAQVDRYTLNPIRGPGGLTEARVASAVAQYGQRLLNLRADTIARTETISAANAGQRELWYQLQDRGALPPQVQREWLTAVDDRTCETCGPLNGERTGLNDSYPSGFTPGDVHANCRCTEVLIV